MKKNMKKILGVTPVSYTHLKERLHELVPAVVGEFAMFSHNSGIVDPFNYTIALAENAHANGEDYYFCLLYTSRCV